MVVIGERGIQFFAPLRQIERGAKDFTADSHLQKPVAADPS